jgi:hypothetical protein
MRILGYIVVSPILTILAVQWVCQKMLEVLEA